MLSGLREDLQEGTGLSEPELVGSLLSPIMLPQRAALGGPLAWRPGPAMLLGLP